VSRLRAGALLVAAASLGALALTQPRAPSSASTVVVATAGATPALVRHLSDSARAPVYVLEGAGDPLRYGAGAEAAPDLVGILRRSPDISQIIVAGWGLEEAELEQAGNRRIVLAPAPLPAGIATIRWTGAVPLGARLEVRGTTTGIAPGAVVRLTGPGGGIDSTRTRADSTFALRVGVAAEGRFDYAVSIGPRAGASPADTVGAAVIRGVPPSVLILDGSPSFESRYVEDWLRRRGGSLALRTEMSRDRYRTRFLNRPPADLERLSPALLADFDVLVIDAEAFGHLPPADRQTIAKAAGEGGIGIIITTNGAATTAAPLLDGLTLASIGSGLRSGRVSWDDRPGRTRVGLAPLRLAGDAATHVLATDSAGEPAAVWRRRGAGAVAVTLVTTPSRWQLGGEAEQFAAYWSLLMGAVARPPAVHWAASQPASVDEPVQLVRIGADSTTSVIIEGPDGRRDSVFLAQDPIVPTRWEGTYWPVAGGWHRVAADSASFDFRVTGGWTAHDAAARREATLARVGARGSEPGAGPGAARDGPSERIGNAPWFRRIPDGLLFALFLASVTVLWSARRAAA